MSNLFTVGPHAFLHIAPCSLVEVYRRFRGACCLHHHGDESQIFPRNYNLFQRDILFTTSMLQSPLEANSRSASQESPSILCNRKFHYRVHKTPPELDGPGLHSLALFPKTHVNIISSSPIYD
jgi:hypothetical protein